LYQRLGRNADPVRGYHQHLSSDDKIPCLPVC
jgi:hypothetical protein